MSWKLSWRFWGEISKNWTWSSPWYVFWQFSDTFKYKFLKFSVIGSRNSLGVLQLPLISFNLQVWKEFLLFQSLHHQLKYLLFYFRSILISLASFNFKFQQFNEIPLVASSQNFPINLFLISTWILNLKNRVGYT